MNVPLRCRCGRVRGGARDVTSTSGFRFVCYCEDCRAFARFLERPDVLDSAGGTDIFHMPAAHVTLTDGQSELRCLSLSERVFRWYAACCNTPIANTATSPRFPVVAIPHTFMDHATHARDEALGPLRCRIFERSATGPLPNDAPPPPSLAFFARRAAKLVSWWTRGLARPNPFFDATSGAPRAAPRPLR